MYWIFAQFTTYSQFLPIMKLAKILTKPSLQCDCKKSNPTYQGISSEGAADMEEVHPLFTAYNQLNMTVLTYC